MTDAIIGLILELLFGVALVSGVIYVTVTRPLNALQEECRKIREQLYAIEFNDAKTSRH
jgi:hypothetical protein